MLREARIVPVGTGGDPVLAQWVERGPERRLTWSWYLGTAGRAEEALRNLLGLERSALRRKGGQLVVRLTTRTATVGGPDASAEARLERLFERLQPALTAAVAPAPAHASGRPQVGFAPAPTFDGTKLPSLPK